MGHTSRLAVKSLSAAGLVLFLGLTHLKDAITQASQGVIKWGSVPIVAIWEAMKEGFVTVYNLALNYQVYQASNSAGEIVWGIITAILLLGFIFSVIWTILDIFTGPEVDPYVSSLVVAIILFVILTLIFGRTELAPIIADNVSQTANGVFNVVL